MFLRPDDSRRGIVGRPQDIVCTVALRSIIDPSTVNLTWNISGTDSRVVIIPTNVTTDDSIGDDYNIYTTVIQFAYLMEGDEGNYTCFLTTTEGSAESDIELKLTGTYVNIIIICVHTFLYMYVHDNTLF